MLDFDVIVIGSGAGGMAAGLKIAQSQHSVLVLEAAPNFGGCLSPITEAGYHFDIGVHYVGQLAKGDSFWASLDEIGMADRVEFVELQPDAIDRYSFPDFELHLCKGKDLFKEQLIQLFPKEERGIHKFFKIYDQVMRAADSFVDLEMRPLKMLGWMLRNPSMRKYARVPYQTLLDAVTSDIRLQTALSASWFDYMLPPDRASVFCGLGTWRHYLSGGYYPRGGSVALRDTFVAALQEQGAEMRCSSPVAEIDRRNGKLQVTSVNGERWICKAVVSNADPMITLSELASPRLVPPRVANKARRLRPSGSLFGVLAGTDLDLPTLGVTSGNLVHYGIYDINKIFREAMVSESPDISKCLFINSPSVKDSDGGLSPKGRHSLQLLAGADYSSFERWATMPSRERGQEYEAYVRKLGEQIVTTVERYIPQLSQHLEFVKYITPLSLEARVNLVRGGLYGPEQTPDQMGLGRFHDGTCGIEGLFLAGAGTKGGGVYFAVISGIQAGRKVIASLT